MSTHPTTPKAARPMSVTTAAAGAATLAETLGYFQPAAPRAVVVPQPSPLEQMYEYYVAAPEAA